MTSLLIFGDQLWTLKLLDRVSQEDVLELQCFGLGVPGINLLVCKFKLTALLFSQLLENIYRGCHLDTFLSEVGQRVFKHSNLFAFLHIKIVFRRLSFEICQLLLDSDHVLFVRDSEIGLMLLNDCLM